MPSLHIAWAVWCTLVAVADLHARGGCARSPSLYPFVTAFAVLATGNHFVLDVLGGLATIAVVAAAGRRSGAACRGGAGGRIARQSAGSGSFHFRVARCHKLVTKSKTG